MVYLLNRQKFLCTRLLSKFLILCKLVERLTIYCPFDLVENYQTIDVGVWAN